MTALDLAAVSDHAVLATLGDQIAPEVTRRVAGLLAAIDESPPPGYVDASPGYVTLLVTFDPLKADHEAVMRHIRSLEMEEKAAAGGAHHEIPVHYGGEHGPDLEWVAQFHGLSPAEVIRRHTAPVYTVCFLGFAPGFGYLSGMDPRLATPRLARPRTRVPAGSVGIGGAQTGIYSTATPGGWRILGWTPVKLFHEDEEPMALLAAGDTVRFIPIQ